jgi:hypothetical protein
LANVSLDTVERFWHLLATWEGFHQVLAMEVPGMDASARFDTQIIGALPVIG